MVPASCSLSRPRSAIAHPSSFVSSPLYTVLSQKATNRHSEELCTFKILVPASPIRSAVCVMETRTLELEIKGAWWMWRGCLQDYFLGYDTEAFCANPVQGIDPMDRYDHKEVSAFPMQKPNFDIFGIPRRTRSQRGWYQVQPHPKAQAKDISVLSIPPSSSDAPATGADLPIELVKLVGQMMSEVLEWSRDDDRRTMMACALVCRYWANQFLYKMFKLTSTDSRQRALGLLEFGRSSACWYRRFVQPEVYMTMKSLGELPFMHPLPCHTYKHAWLRGPLPRSWKTMRSVHWGLPRPVPRSFSSGIISLALTDIHFQRFSDLVDLVCELPDVQHLHCTKVTWGTLPDTILTLSRRRRTHKGKLQITTDSDMWVQAGAHLLTCYLSRHGHPFFPPDVVLALVSIVDHIFRISNMADGSKSDVIPRYVWYRSENPCFSLSM